MVIKTAIEAQAVPSFECGLEPHESRRSIIGLESIRFEHMEQVLSRKDPDLNVR